MKITRITFMCLCVLAITQVSFAGYNEMYIDPKGYFNLGEVEIGSSSSGYLMVRNIGVASAMWVNYRILEGGSPCFTVIVYNSWPALAMDSDSYWIEIVFSPISVGNFTAVVEFSATSYIPGDPVYDPVQCVTIEGTGVLPAYDTTVEFFDQAVADGSLVGVGSGNSADNKLNALRNMLLEAQRLIDAGDYEAACDQLYSAYKKCDGEPNPPDFVAGDSREALEQMILDLMQDLGCNQNLGKPIAPGLENNTVLLPTEFALEQNQPNPFNPTTTINYTVAKPSHVKLTVYNTLGQAVAVLVNEYQVQGTYGVTWDAGNQPSGLYLCRFEADGFTATKKMFLQK